MTGGNANWDLIKSEQDAIKTCIQDAYKRGEISHDQCRKELGELCADFRRLFGEEPKWRLPHVIR
jgi:hypothetical protein